jgi:hypothetical protein
MFEKQASGAATIQVFELTMDNFEDQDELNRKLHKPGEPNISPSENTGRKVQDESTVESAEKKRGDRGS